MDLENLNTQQAYDLWAGSYDSVINKTRDLEKIAAASILQDADFSAVLEIGCGTGKNTSWLSEKATTLTAVDFSVEMLNLARKKITMNNVQFIQADLLSEWTFGKHSLIVCSLVLEHIKDLDFIFREAAKCLNNNGLFYICELHPNKQLQGSRAKFQQQEKLVELEYFVHQISDFIKSASNAGFTLNKFDEWFDDDNRSTVPRLASFLFRRT